MIQLAAAVTCDGKGCNAGGAGQPAITGVHLVLVENGTLVFEPSLDAAKARAQLSDQGWLLRIRAHHPQIYEAYCPACRAGIERQEERQRAGYAAARRQSGRGT